MKIAFCIFKYFNYGGLQRDFRALIEECVRRGFHVDVYALVWEGEHFPGAHIHVLPIKTITSHTRYQKFAKQLGKIFARESYDVVVGFNKIPYLDVYFAGDPCYEAKAQELRGALYRLTLRYFYFAKLERAVFALDAKTRVLLLTPQQQKEFQRYYQTPSERFHQLTPWLREDKHPVAEHAAIRVKMRSQLQLNDDDHFILMVGSGFKAKGLDRALVAIYSLPKAILEKTQFFIIGDDKQESFTHQIEKLQLKSQVHFLGGKSNVRDYYYAADVLIHPAYWETAGHVILEAVVNGLPVIVTENCGYAHHVAKANAGFVISNPFVQSDLNTALLSALTSLEKTHWQQNGLAYFNNNDFNSMPQRAVDFITTVNQNTQRFNHPEFYCYVEKPLANRFKSNNVFEEIMALQGETFRHKENRKTLRFVDKNKAYFAKLHFGVGYKEIIKNFLQFRLPIVSAKNEWQAILRLEQLNVPTMKLVGFGSKGKNPARQQSFLITESLEEMINLEEFCRTFRKTPPSFKTKLHLTKALASSVKKMHEGGLNHRDLYFCHFLLSKTANFDDENEELYVIDLHRVQKHRQVPKRWLVKDLGSLYFSTMGMAISQKDVLRFLKYYTGEPLRQTLTENNPFWQACVQRGKSLYKKACRKIPGYLAMIEETMVKGAITK